MTHIFCWPSISLLVLKAFFMVTIGAETRFPSNLSTLEGVRCPSRSSERVFTQGPEIPSGSKLLGVQPFILVFLQQSYWGSFFLWRKFLLHCQNSLADNKYFWRTPKRKKKKHEFTTTTTG